MNSNEFEKTAIRVSNVSIWGNTLLALFKLLAGIIAHSGAIVSDAVHSFSDVFSSIVVIIGVKMAAKAEDEDHPYGHERLESVAAIILAVVLLVTGLFIGHAAIENLSAQNQPEHTIPGILALIAAAVSIIVKEAMYWYTKVYAIRIDSDALMADAWHHRSDALSSIGALIGIYGARMGLWWFDAAASLVICLFIVKAAYDIFINAVEKMVDHACSDKFQKELEAYVLTQAENTRIKRLKTREFGNRIYVELELMADGSMSLFESNRISEKVHDAIEKAYPKIKHIIVKMLPDDEIR